MKRRSLSKKEEFEIMKLVIDKFLLFSVFILAFGFYRIVSNIGNLGYNILIMVAAIILLILFAVILEKEYEYIKL
jgi:hypothetical protein